MHEADPEKNPELVAHLRERIAVLEGQLSAAEAASTLMGSVDAMLEGVQIIGFDWRYLYVNETAARHGHTHREALLGQTMMAAYPGIDQTPMFGELRRAMKTRARLRFENRFVYPHGNSGWFELMVEPVPAGLLIFSVDITERKRALEDLRQSEESLAAILACMADAVVATDTTGRIERLNPAAETLLGVAETEAQGNPLCRLAEFKNQVTLAPIADPVGTILQQEVLEGFAEGTVLVREDGRQMPVSSSGAPLRNRGGALRGVVIVLRDLSREQSLRAQLERAQKMEGIGRLAGGIAHDFNNALSVILSTARLMVEEWHPEPGARNDLEQIERAAQHAASLTRQLLAFSRHQVWRPTVLDVNVILRNLDRMLRRVLPENIELRTRLGPQIGRVRADVGQLEQVIMNLTVNAADAMPAGGVLSATTEDVVLTQKHADAHPDARPGPHVMIAIQDSGHGMDEATKGRIFEPFFTTKPKDKGTGLGLATAYGIVRQSGGHIVVDSHPGEGATFRVYFPAVEAALELPSAPIARAGGGSETILLVEDDADLREAAARVLRRQGYTVRVAANDVEAWAAAARHPDIIHLLLTDVALKGRSGVELAQALREKRPDTKVLFMSGYTADTVLRDGPAEGDFLQKPFTPQVLGARVREVLDRRSDRAANNRG